MAITLKQIAEMAGVHKSTVDKVIHDRPGVSAEMRQKIKQLLAEQGYESNPLAKALNYQKKKLTVAVVLTQVDAVDEIKKGIELTRADYTSFNIKIEYHEIPYADANAQAECLRALQKRKIEGIVVNPLENEEVRHVLNELNEQGIPVVLVNSDMEQCERLCFVGRNEIQAGRVAGRLVGLLIGGIGNVGILTSSLHAVQQRERSFEQFLQTYYPNIYIRHKKDTREDKFRAYHLTCEMLEQDSSLSALFIACGCVGEVCKAVRDCGQSKQICIVCYERYPEIVELINNQEISCAISGDLVGQGQIAMRTLFERLVYEKTPPKQTLYMQNNILLKENI